MLPTCKIICGDALATLPELPAESIQCCITSPPYYGLRDYGTGRWEGGDPACDHSRRTSTKTGAVTTQSMPHNSNHELEPWLGGVCGKCGAVRVDQQIGIEATPEQYIDKIVQLGQGIRNALREDGTFWLNLGDSYYNYRPGCISQPKQTLTRHEGAVVEKTAKRSTRLAGFKEKDRLMIPARCAIALQQDGWFLRDEIVWHKPNPMPESVTDRTTKSHEFMYLLTKSKDYYYDAEAIKEKVTSENPTSSQEYRASINRGSNNRMAHSFDPDTTQKAFGNPESGNRNKRSVWKVATVNCSDPHFAPFPPDLIKPCIMAGSRTGDTILDPCGGRGTLGEVAMELGRNAILIEINPKYAALCAANVNDTTPGLPLC
jgi:DNA modification methylase